MHDFQEKKKEEKRKDWHPGTGVETYRIGQDGESKPEDQKPGLDIKLCPWLPLFQGLQNLESNPVGSEGDKAPEECQEPLGEDGPSEKPNYTTPELGVVVLGPPARRDIGGSTSMAETREIDYFEVFLVSGRLDQGVAPAVGKAAVCRHSVHAINNATSHIDIRPSG